VKIRDVSREVLPELNDEFALRIEPECGGIDDLRNTVREGLRQRAEDGEKKAFEERVLDKLVEESQIAFPPLLLEDEIERMVREYIDRLRNSTKSEEEFKSILEMTKQDQLRETYRPKAEQRVKRNLVVSKLVEVEKIEAADSDIDMQIAALTADAGDKLKERTVYLNKPENRDTLRWWLTAGKARQWLVDKVQAD
jgi:trigger factor